jgi:hypothetical protein
MRTQALWATIIALAGVTRASAVLAQNDLRKNLKDTNVADHWIYDDIAAGFADARESGKPLLVTFRCVP